MGIASAGAKLGTVSAAGVFWLPLGGRDRFGPAVRIPLTPREPVSGGALRAKATFNQKGAANAGKPRLGRRRGRSDRINRLVTMVLRFAYP